MNYIKQLQEDKKNLAVKVAKVYLELNDFVIFLQTSPKFQGNESDGARKDWISTADVINRLQEIKNIV